MSKTFISKCAAVLFALATVLSATAVPVARAAGFTVTNLNDSGSGSLRQAILDANASPATDTITFNVSGTITLASSLPLINDRSGLTIDGSGRAVTINGNNAVQIFTVDLGSALTLQNLTIANSTNSAIYTEGGWITVNTVTFSGNGAAAYGGAIALDSFSEATISNSTFSGNSASHGGAIWSVGRLFIFDSTFSNNNAGDGGAIANEFHLSVANTNFSGNSAIFGGAIYNTGVILNVTGGSFSTNTASSSVGGAIYNDTSSILSILNATFTSNSARNGGGGIYSAGTLNVTDSSFSSNSSGGLGGGGILNDNNATVTGSTFLNNSASGSVGGGINNRGSMTITNSTFSGNTSLQGGAGGALSNESGHTLTLSGSTLSNNSAIEGGAISNTGTMNVTNSTLAGNNGFEGGAVNNFGSLLIIHSTLANNAATSAGGGLFNQGALTLKNSIVADSAAGGNCSGATTNGGGNLSYPDATCPGVNGDPRLAGLANNGGSTQTMALQAGSAAINAINIVNGSCNDTGVTTDQRGVTRPQGTHCDIGAFELEQAAPTVTPAPTNTNTPTNPPTNTLTSTPTATTIPSRTPTATFTNTPEPTNIPTDTPTSTPTNTPVPPTATPTHTLTPTRTPTSTPTIFRYNFTGFFQPVDNLPTLNVVNAGKGISVKFSLGGNQGLNVLAAGYPTSQPIACAAGAALDSIEQVVTASNNSLVYDPTTATYIYKWKTDKAWAGTCRQLIVRLSDGTEHVANFKFK